MADPASIRTFNPGAQWYGPSARRFGATGSLPLPGGNNAAIFDDPVSGAAAQFDLLRRNYSGMPLSAAIAKWSGGNSSPQYVDFIQKNTGISPDTVLTPELLQSPQGVALARAQAQWEAGRPYPMTEEQWRAAQGRAFGEAGPGAPPAPASAEPRMFGSLAGPEGAPTAAAQSPNVNIPGLLASMGSQMMRSSESPEPLEITRRDDRGRRELLRRFMEAIG